MLTRLKAELIFCPTACVSIVTGSPDCRRIIGIGFRVYRMPAVEELCQCTTTILTPNFVQRLFVFHRTQCRTLQQHIEVEVLPLQAGIQAELQPRSLVKGKRMFVLTVNLAVTIPVFILIITRQDVAFLEAVVIPNIVPTGVTTGGSITKLYPLITVRQVVVAPAIIRVGPRSFFRSSQVFLTGNGSNTLSGYSLLHQSYYGGSAPIPYRIGGRCPGFHAEQWHLPR